MAPIPYIGKAFADAKSFLDYLDDIKFGAWRPKFIVMHHTGAPSLKQWENWQTRTMPVSDIQWMANLAAYYGNEMRWSSGPHFFFTPKHFCVFSPPTKRGVHAVSFNAISWGVEVVGNFDTEDFNPLLRDRYAQGLACLYLATGLELEPYVYQKNGLHFHRDDPKTTKTCPGTKVLKSNMVASISLHIKALAGHDGEDEESVTEIPDTPDKTGVTNTKDLNVRASASAKAPIVHVLPKGATITITGEAMNGTTKWYQIHDGWIAARYVDLV